MTRHIFLIGFMGSGKTHWGKIAGKRLGCLFIDLDEFIESNEGSTISEIFADSGENGFRELEREYLHRLVTLPPAVIAVGGGTPCFFNNMDWMKKYGLTVYLKTAPEILFERLKYKRHHRPLLKDLNDEELKVFIRNLLNAREPFYNRADIVLDQVKDTATFFEDELAGLTMVKE